MPLSLPFVYEAQGQSAEEILQQAEKFYEKKDYIKAASLLRQVAEQGDALALHNLATMHESGDGVKKDRLTAYALLLLSINEGNKPARESATRIREKLTAEQITAGQKIAREWQQRIEANKQKRAN